MEQDARSRAQVAPKPDFIYRDGMKLMLNGSQYKFAGFNADTWFGCWPNEIPTDAQLEKYFSELNPRSMTRIWPYPGTDLAIMDRIVKAAEKHNQYLAPSLMDGNADCGQPEPNYANPSRELAWIDQIVPRYKNSKAIGFWELINEPSGSNSNLKNYYKAMSDRIRSHDPNHLIGTGSHAAWSAGENNEAKYISDHDLPNIDLISMHEYDAATGVSHWGAASSRASRALNKPWYAGEDGFCCGGGDAGSDTANAEKLKAEWAAYIAVPESAGMLYWDFKLGHENRSTANFNNALWTAGKTFRHQYTGGTATNPGTSTTPGTGGQNPTISYGQISLPPSPTTITPTYQCLAGTPCTSPLPSATVAPGVTGGAGQITLPPVGGTNPSGNPSIPNPSTQPCVNDTISGIMHEKKKPKFENGGGIIERFLQFLFKLLEMFFKFLGIPVPNMPNPGNPGQIPQPTQTPGGVNPNPTQAPSVSPIPCPEPTTPPVGGQQPSTVPSVSTAPSAAPSPTIFGQPTTNPQVTTAPGSMPAITVSGNKIQRGGQDWWFIGYNSFVWSGDCGNPEEKMSAAQVDAWFASMRHDGHGAVRLFFYSGWDMGRLDAAIASAKKHNIYLIITLDDAIGGCGENDKTDAWFDNASERSTFKAHMSNLLTKYKGETAIFAFEYFNEPSFRGGKLRQFYDEMGAHAKTIDPNRLFSSGTVAPYWLGSEANFKNVHESPGVHIASLHEYDQDEIESNHGPKVRANSAGKPVIAGEFGIDSNQSGSGCKTSFTERARRFTEKAKAYTGNGYVGGFAWAWQPGNGGGSCEYGNIDADTPTQNAFRTHTR